ncbi:TPA: HNH endonuclease signature motif containing protein [Streptococcus suis]
MRRKAIVYQDEWVDFIRKNATGTKISDLTERLNAEFNLNLVPSQVARMKKRFKVHSGRVKIDVAQIFNEEQKDFIRKNVKGLLYRDLARLLNAEFGTGFSVEQVRSWAKRNKLKNGMPGGIQKGEKRPGWSNSGTFKKGLIPHNKKKIGDERICDGYIWVKVAEPDVWKAKHRHVYEQHHNIKLGKDDILIFLDNDRTNCDIDNLYLVNRSIHARANTLHYRTEDPLVTKIGVGIIQLDETLSKRRGK